MKKLLLLVGICIFLSHSFVNAEETEEILFEDLGWVKDMLAYSKENYSECDYYLKSCKRDNEGWEDFCQKKVTNCNENSNLITLHYHF